MTNQLNDDQQASFIDVINFINGPDQFMHISGGAGTGKTFFIAAVADNILRQKTSECTLHTVAITATTNKAAAVIQEAMPHRAGEIGTIYSLMNLRLSENFSTGVAKVVPTNKFEVHSGTLIIIDEDSMINAELFKYLQIGIDQSCKVLFVGDQNQLAPVKEELSPIFSQGYKSSFLTKPVRNAGSPALMALCEQAKLTVLTGVFTPIVEVPGVIDFVDGPGLKGVLEREYAVEDPLRRILSYTNKQVILYNSFIRTLRGYTEPYEIGEILTNNSSAELAGKERLYTDQTVVVDSIVSDEMNSVIVPGHSIRTITMMVSDANTSRTYKVTCFAYPQDRADAMKFYSSTKAWDKYFRIKNTFPELRSVAASTTHKAQGSTYDTVIVDLADIGKSTNRMQTARMQYVALSRPKVRLYIKGVLPPRYFTT